MSRSRFVVSILALAASLSISTQAETSSPPQKIWSDGPYSIWLAPTNDTSLSEEWSQIIVRGPSGSQTTKAGDSKFIEAYPTDTIKVFFASKPGARTPTVLIYGNTYGSAACGGIIGVLFKPRISYQEILSCPQENPPDVTVQAGIPHFEFGIKVEDADVFGAGSASGELPIMWKGQKFQPDLAALKSTSFNSAKVTQFRTSIAHDITALIESNAQYYPYRPTEAVTLLMELILSGHSQQAHSLLLESWPTYFTDLPPSTAQALKPQSAFMWHEICVSLWRTAIDNPVGLTEIPEFNLIKSEAEKPEPANVLQKLLPASLF